MALPKREHLLNVRMHEAEGRMLSALAEADGITVSEWVRNSIRVQHALRFGAVPKPRPKNKKR